MVGSTTHLQLTPWSFLCWNSHLPNARFYTCKKWVEGAATGWGSHMIMSPHERAIIVAPGIRKPGGGNWRPHASMQAAAAVEPMLRRRRHHLSTSISCCKLEVSCSFTHPKKHQKYKLRHRWPHRGWQLSVAALITARQGSWNLVWSAKSSPPRSHYLAVLFCTITHFQLH